MLRALVLATIAVALSGCQPSRSWVARTPEKSGPCSTEPGGWCDFTRKAAKRAWLYALLSNNVYERAAEQYELPEYVKLHKHFPNDGIGFSYSVYDISTDGRLSEVVIVFRGTEGFTREGLKDWAWGNIPARQNKRGLDAVKTVFERLRQDNQGAVEVTVTGHSLGGGIAHHVSLREITLEDGTKKSVTRSIVFNNSPRFWRDGAVPQVDRLAVVEYGEALKIFRLPARSPTQTYVSLNCRPSGFRAVRDHSMYYLAGCLTWIAAFDDAKARVSVRDNSINKPASQLSADDPTGSN